MLQLLIEISKKQKHISFASKRATLSGSFACWAATPGGSFPCTPATPSASFVSWSATVSILLDNRPIAFLIRWFSLLVISLISSTSSLKILL